MAEILPFSRGRAKPSRSVERDTAGEVVIFPGIRIEYHEDQPALAKPDRRGTRRNTPNDVLSA
jgi:hypothetical protein